MKKNIDQRIIFTQKLLKEALIILLNKKAIDSISVKELCDKAAINRSTFYSHYNCIYDLLEEIENDMFEELVSTFNNFKLLDPSDKDIYKVLFAFFAKNSAMFKILLGSNSDIKFLHKMLELGEKLYNDYFEKTGLNIDKEKLEIFYQFASSGFIGILSVWLQNNMDTSIDDLSANIRQIINTGIGYLQQK